MTEPIHLLANLLANLLASLLVGATLGAVFFAGLWNTVQRLCRREHAIVWAGTSLGIRLLLAAAVFGLVSRFGLAELLAALAGFMTARWAAVRRWGGGSRRRGEPCA